MPIAFDPGALDLGSHLLHLQRLDRASVEFQFLGDTTDRGLLAMTADMERKALGEARIVRQKIQLFALHDAAGAARDSRLRFL